MKRFWNRLLIMKPGTVFLILVIILVTPITSRAQGSHMEKGALTPPPTEGIPATDPYYGSSSLDGFSIQSYSLLEQMTNYIRNNNNGTVTIGGETRTSYTVSEVSVMLYLQKWDGTKWVTISDAYPFKVTNDYTVSGSKNLTITRGYYYRTKSVHMAKDGALVESDTRYSDYILVPQ